MNAINLHLFLGKRHNKRKKKQQQIHQWIDKENRLDLIRIDSLSNDNGRQQNQNTNVYRTLSTHNTVHHVAHLTFKKNSTKSSFPTNLKHILHLCSKTKTKRRNKRKNNSLLPPTPHYFEKKKTPPPFGLQRYLAFRGATSPLGFW